MATHTLPPPGGRRGVTVPSRRDLLGAGAFTALAGIAAVAIAKPDTRVGAALPAPHQDAELIALGERFLDLERQVRINHRTLLEDEPCDAANEPLEAEQKAILGRMHGLRATTLEAHRMRARVAFAFSPELKEEGGPGDYNNQQMIWLLVRDLVGGEAA